MSIGQLLNPSKITGWLGCPHSLTLHDRVARGTMARPEMKFGSFARLLQDKGLEHERAVLDHMRVEGLRVEEVPAKNDDESFEQWVARTAHVLTAGPDVVYQLPMIHDGMRGIVDFLERVDGPSALGDFHYEPVDAKLARAQAKPGHVLQLCFYADALEAAQGVRPQNLHLELGSGDRESIRLRDVEAYWRRLRRRLAEAIAADPDDPSRPATEPAKCTHCEFCEFATHCDQQWRDEDALHFVAHLRSTDLVHLKDAGVDTLTALAERDPRGEVAGVRPERLSSLANQARLQFQARTDGSTPFEILEDDPEHHEGRGRLPEPDQADVFLDFEGHPFLTPARGLFFLFGALHRVDSGEWEFGEWWAHDPVEEAAATGALIEWLHERWLQHPTMHVYHYNHTERSELERLTIEYGVGNIRLAELLTAGVFVDLYDVIRNAVRIGVESYGLKSVEPLSGYERGHDIDRGAVAVLEYEAWTRDRDDDRLRAIARYNEDDVRATRAVRDWLLAGPLAGREWRSAPEEVEPWEVNPDVDTLIATGEKWKVTLAHLLGYWPRERSATWAQGLTSLASPVSDQITSPNVITGLRHVEDRPPEGKERKPRAVFSFPPQELSGDLAPKANLVYPRDADGAKLAWLRIDSIDVDAGELVVARTDALDEHPLPSAVAIDDWMNPGSKPDVMQEILREVVEGGDNEPRAAPEYDVLLRRRPRLVDGATFPGGFPTEVAEIVEVAAALDRGVLAVQGPPGTGKTYTGAHVIKRLVADGKRVGVTAFSHMAIDNLLRAALDLDPGLRIDRQGARPSDLPRSLPDARYNVTPEKWRSGSGQVLGGTTWLFGRPDMTGDRAVDVLLIDEAGQMGLADAIVAMRSARSVVLLGDPLQLAQVRKATHPMGSGASVLEHVLDGAPTIAPDRGVFLDVTRRMHTNVCSFISEQIYEDRLRPHPSCDQQSIGGVSELRWSTARHSGRSTSSPEEAELVVSTVRDLLGQEWVDATGARRPMTAADVMVVAPYNEHVRLVRRTLARHPDLAGVRVGTVDKFQGQEAPAVVFTMATSSGADLPRNIEFLFSRNRLNVAISRARAVAVVICTDELLDTPANDVDDMRLIGTLCAFVERAGGRTAGAPRPPAEADVGREQRGDAPRS